MTEVHVPSLVEAARPHHDPELEYHNFERSGAMLAELEALVPPLGRAGLTGHTLNALRLGIAWSSAGYHQDHRMYSQPTKAHHSARLIESLLMKSTHAGAYRGEVGPLIVATLDRFDRTTAPELLMRRLHLGDAGGPYDDFLPKNVALWLETQRLTGQAIPWSKWQATSARSLDAAIDEARREIPALNDALDVTDPLFTLGGEDSFDTHADRNRDLLLAEPEPAAGVR